MSRHGQVPEDGHSVFLRNAIITHKTTTGNFTAAVASAVTEHAHRPTEGACRRPRHRWNDNIKTDITEIMTML